MAAHTSSAQQPPLDLSKWAKLPAILLALGVLGCAIGLFTSPKQLGYSYLVAFMFSLSLCVGALFLTIMHYLFDSQWMVPVRRIWESIIMLFPVLFVLFIPILVNVWVGHDNAIFPWATKTPDEAHHTAGLANKIIMFNKTSFTVMAFVLFGIWTLMALAFRRNSVAQDATGAAIHTIRCRRYAAGGIFLFAITTTLGVFYWMKSLEFQFFSTMYGVYYFAGSVWTTLATTYVLALVLKRAGPLKDIVLPVTMHDIGKLFFAFTVFYAYIHFSQYFLIWNAALPEETFWYIKREQGTWWYVCMLIVFGHFFLPFLSLLRIDAKLSLPLMGPMCAWAWLMHAVDMHFNIMPVIHEQVSIHWLDFTTFFLFIGAFAIAFIRIYKSAAPYPQQDPRIAETMGVYVEPRSAHNP